MILQDYPFYLLLQLLSYDDSYDNNDDDWDNSREAGGMPRDLSPFSDIDDPYDRAELEWDMFDERDDF